MKKILFAMLTLVATGVHAQTKLQQTQEKFKNNEFVWEVLADDKRVGEFWPIHSLNLVTKDTDPQSFTATKDLRTLQTSLGAVATAPDGMTGGSIGAYKLQGKCLSHGRPCGDGFMYQYGIVCVSPNGYSIQFTHANEIRNFDSLYSKYRTNGATLFFLPSIYRNGNSLPSLKTVDKVLVRRETPLGEQIGVILFDQLTTYDRVREIILGLDRQGKSKTTHIYVLDGGKSWGQSCRETNGTFHLLGTRDPTVVTNYLVFY